MPDLPTGTVTFLFTDLEGSTPIAHRLGDEWHGLLVAHRNLVRTAVADSGGAEIDVRGDEFFVAFEHAAAAASAAIAAQRALSTHPWPEGAELRARMGMHTGHAIFEDEDYLGVDVHRAARICFAGHGGQILASEATHALLPDELERRDLGTYRLRGLPEPERIFQVVAPGLTSDFPGLRSASGGAEGLALRVVLADDSVLLREGIALLLEQSGFEIVGQSDDADDLLRKVDATEPDVVVADIRMPPGHADDGLRAAESIRREHPEIGVLLLSQYAEPAYARELLANGAAGVGYLLKDRVSDLTGFADAVRRVAAGEVVLDPEIAI
ncbi:MAG TPA: response regulator [Gaiellaceae bacterium]|nr:response regulator [Gaiellaceae bacterium]